jgi:S1-C subfamily serine protease
MYVTSNIYERVVRVEAADRLGTGFIVERGDSMYIVTARHVLPADEEEPFTIANRFHRWSGRASLLPGIHPGVDIAVTEVPSEFGQPEFPIELTSDGMTYSQDVFFLGYPYGMALRMYGEDQLPFVKKATLSASDRRSEQEVVWYLDGLNNPGFSGGPVVFFQHGRTEPTRIAAVVSGYTPDWQQLLVGGEPATRDIGILANSGIIIAYDIKHAVAALDG